MSNACCSSTVSPAEFAYRGFAEKTNTISTGEALVPIVMCTIALSELRRAWISKFGD